jgi:hypothetical protein
MKSAFACRAAFALSAAGSGRGAAALAVRSSSSSLAVSLRTPASGGCSGWRSFADAAAGGGGGGGGMMGQIKELRARTGAGVMDCKEALAASAGDPAKAELWLLDKARSRFAKKAERPTTEGTLALALAHDSSEALLLEVRGLLPLSFSFFTPHTHATAHAHARAHTRTSTAFPFRTGERFAPRG